MNWKRVIVVGILTVLLTIAPMIWNNAGGGGALADFDKELTRAMGASRDWLLCKDFAEPSECRTRIKDVMTNAALLLMVADCARLSGDRELQAMVGAYVTTRQESPWLRMVDPKGPFVAPSAEHWRSLLDYQRWFLWAMAPGRIQLVAEERADLESPDQMKRGRLTHQLMAWVLYRNMHGSTPQLEARIRHLAERVAGEAVLDFRITDMYLQRVAFVLYAGHPDLIPSRWVDRVLSGQQADGGWNWAWYGWGPRFFHLRIPDDRSSAHSTVQGLWILYMLKYRYPGWTKRNYR